MKLFLTLITIAFCFSCKKKYPDLNHNEFKATVLFSSGTILYVNAKGPRTYMGCGGYNGTAIQGTAENNSAVYCSLYNGIQCITAPGTYPFSCEYRVEAASGDTYLNNGTAHPGSLTFTVNNKTNMEGYFDAVCKDHNGDSVTVTGTFKGDYIH
jgi:hypothetical protein